MSSDEFFRLVRTWLTIHLPRARRLSPHAIRSYKTALNALLDYLREDPALVAVWLDVKHVRPVRAVVHAPDGLTMPAVDALI